MFVAFTVEMLLRFVKFQVKLSNFDGISKRSAIV